jgi:hypothetical protein
MTEDRFEAACAKAKRIAVAAAENDKAIVAAARAERHTKKRQVREKREKDLSVKLLALPNRKYGVILADPEWKFEF